MFPVLTLGDAANSSFGYAILCGYLLMHTTVFEMYKYLFDLRASQFRARMLFSFYGRFWSGRGNKNHPALPNRIVNVIGLCAKEQVIRTHTGWVVARVANVKAIGNIAIVNNPGKTMGQPLPAVSESDKTVSAIVPKSNPLPTIIALFDAPPKNFFRRSASITAVTPPVAKQPAPTVKVAGSYPEGIAALVTPNKVSRNCSVVAARARRMLNASGVKDNGFDT